MCNFGLSLDGLEIWHKNADTVHRNLQQAGSVLMSPSASVYMDV